MKTPTKKDFLNDLYLFYRLFIASNYKDDVPAPHIKQLSRKLMALRNGEGKSRIAVSMPPRHSKSSMVTLAFPLWLIFQNPDVHIMIVTGSPKLSDKFGIQLREYVRELGPYFNVYLSDVKQASTHLMFCDANKKLYKGNLILASSGGGITGQDADYLIVDDPYRGNDDEFTPSALQKKIDWANRVIEQRIEPHTKYDLSDDTPVYTSNRGWTTHGDLKVGDILIGSDRKKTRIIKVHPKTSCDNCLVFSNGDKIVCGNEHLWKLYDNENNITRLFTTREVMERQLIKENTYESTFTIPVSKSKCINLIDAYKIDEPKPSNCITVEAHDGIYLVGRHFTPTHNCILHTRWHPCSKETPILTTKGWTTHGELKEGDYVFHPSGKPTKVVKIHPDVMVDNCFEFANGDKIITGDHHLWNVYDWGNHKERLMETHEIMQRQTLVGKNNTRCNFLVGNHNPLQYPEQEVPIDPYWLGLWLGDGNSRSPSISVECGDEICCESTPYKVIRYDEGTGRCKVAIFTHQDLVPKLKELNVFKNKHIPNIYLHNSYEVRMELLAGLIDSDGSVEKSANRVVFVNTNKTLLKQAHELMTGLGFNVKVEERPSEIVNKYKEKNSNDLKIISRKDAYALRITPHLPIPTKIPRKKIRGSGVSNRIGLTDKYKVKPVIGNCITVEANDGMYLVGKNLTQTHNSRDLIGYYKEEDPESYDFIEFPALDENEEPLWKERYSKEELLKKKQVVGERVFQSVYQQQPIDTTSDFFNIQRLKFGLPTGFDEQSVCRAWDIASSGVSNNDYTAGAKLQRYDDYCVISDLVYGQFGGETPKVIQHTAEADTPTCHIVVETGVAAAGQLLYQEWKKQLPGFFVEQAKVSGGKSKVDRATPFKNAVEDGKVYINISNPEIRQAIMDELNSFPNGHHDDITDAISHGYNYLFMNEDATKKATAKMRVIHI